MFTVGCVVSGGDSIAVFLDVWDNGWMVLLDVRGRRDSRKAAVGLSLHSLALEGGQLDAGMASLAREYTDGLIDEDELINRTRVRCGLPALSHVE